MTLPDPPLRRLHACVVGSVNVDLFVLVDELPARGATVLGLGTRRAVGGKGANQAGPLARGGAAPPGVGALGVAVAGRAAVAALATNHVDHGGLRRIPGQQTGFAAITVDARGENTIVVSAGANDACTPLVVRSEKRRIAMPELLVAQLEIPTDSVLEAFGIAERALTLRVLNAAPARPVPDGLFRLTDVLVVNEVEAAALSGIADDAERAAFALLERGPNVVAVTLGAHGSLAVDHSGEAYHAPAHRVTPVDTTGAGDAFVACFAILQACRADLAGSLRAANVAAALSTKVLGAQAGLPTWEDVTAALR